MLKLADGLNLPDEAATQTFLVVGKRGSGKSTTSVRLAEQMMKEHVPIVVIDPVDRRARRQGARPLRLRRRR
jgi:signal recognition particle GTPase